MTDEAPTPEEVALYVKALRYHPAQPGNVLGLSSDFREVTADMLEWLAAEVARLKAALVAVRDMPEHYDDFSPDAMKGHDIARDEAAEIAIAALAGKGI